MALNGSQLSTLLTTYLHNDVSISAADKLLYLTLGQQRMVRDSPSTLSTKQTTLSLTSGDTTREYSLPSDFYMMQAVWLPVMGYKLGPMLDAEFIDTVERLPVIPTGPPRDYCILGYDETLTPPRFRIRFNYTPNDDYTVYIWYYWMPADVTAVLTPVVCAMGFTECLLWAACSIALQPKDPEGYQQAEGNYQRLMEDFRAYRPMGADYTPILRPLTSETVGRRGPTLGPHFPVS
jgi:hypothetical protein